MYEENSKCVSRCGKKIRIGLPKGNIFGKSIKLVEDFTKNCVRKGQLSYEYKNFIFYFLKHRDIPILIANGKLDFGITSDEWLVETETKLERIKALDWCDTKIAFIVSNNNINEIKNCITEYPNIARKYFNEKIKVDYVSGSCEALVPTIYDCCIGCIESGKTLTNNNLVFNKVIMESKIIFISASSEIDIVSELLDYM